MKIYRIKRFFSEMRRKCLVMFLLAFMTLQISAQITIKVKDQTIRQTLEQIEKRSNYNFFFNDDFRDLDKKVTLNLSNSTITHLMKKLLENTNLTYSIEEDEKLIVLALSVQQVVKPQTSSVLKITGIVTDSRGESLPGAVVIATGESRVIATADIDGKYAISTNKGASLEFTYIGYHTQEVTVNIQSVIDIVLKEDVDLIDGIVITALGIKKKEKSLTYATQVVGGEELIRAKDINLMNTLAGKTAGVQINKSSSGLGGSSRVIIRGIRSVSGSNQPLYVIDGVPINSSSINATSTSIGGNNDSGNRDGGDGISNLNPDDIESMNILKGPAAAALYGSSAANGVIVITTKKGRAGQTNINFSTNTTFEDAVYGIPEFQNSYGGVTSSWGEPVSQEANYTDDFFQTGVTTINSVSIDRGTEKMQTYFSYAHTYAKGVIENSKLNKHNFNFRETANFFNNRLLVDANVNLMYQTAENRSTPGGFYLNPLVGLYKFPRGGKVQGGETYEHYRDNYAVMDEGRNMLTQNWYTVPATWEQNPYWLTNMLPSQDKRFRTIAGLNLSLKLTEYLSIQARGNADFVTDEYEQRMYAGTTPALASPNGRFITEMSNDLNIYGDLLLTYSQEFENLAINVNVGASIKDASGKSMGVDSHPAGLYNPNIFSIGNMDLNGGSPSLGQYRVQDQAVFFAGQLGFKDWLFLDVTARNDWTSTLAFTDYAKKGFFYPSVGLTWVMNEALNMPTWIDLGKIRGAWSKVGNGLPRYRSNPLNSVGRGGTISFNSTAPFTELQPEMTSSIEVGTDWRFFESRLVFDFTYYQTRTRNQLFSLRAPSGSKYTVYYVNAGDIKNEGIEVVLGATPIMTNDFIWKTNLNYAHNNNTVLELAEGLGYFDFGGGGSNSYGMRLEVGGSFGDIFGRAFLRDDAGNYEYDADGMPLKDAEDLRKLGNTSPDFNLSWSNTFSYKGFSLYFLIDGRFGGDVISLTQAELDKYGVTKRTGDQRNNGGVEFDGKMIEDVARFYAIVGGRDGISENYISDATNIRLRELSIGYSLPSRLFENSKSFKGVDLSLVGRNLFFFMNNAPHDPDGTLSVGNGLQGVDVFGMPTTRSVGFNMKLKF